MTYLQLMIKVLNVFIKETPSKDYHEYWRRTNETIEEFRKGLKLNLMYLLITKINNQSQVNQNLLKVLERQLTSYDVSLTKTLDLAKNITEKELLQDPYDFDSMCLIQDEELDEELKKELIEDIANEYLEKFNQNLRDNVQLAIIAKPMDNILFNVITLLPELFFTEKGYSYIPEEYKISDNKLREECYYYIQNSLCSYKNYRIDDYGREKFGISKVDSNEDEFDEYDINQYEDSEYESADYEDNEVDDIEDGKQPSKDYGVEEWVIDTQFTGYSGLYYAVKLIKTVLKFIKNKQYDKLKKFISIDEYIQRESEKKQGEQDHYSLIEILYDTRSIKELELSDKAFEANENDKYLNFFLEDSFLSSTLTNHQIGRLILYYFDSKDKNSINEIKNNLNELEIRRILRPKETNLFDSILYDSHLENRPYFKKDDSNYFWINADVTCEDRAVRTVVFDDDDESYVPDCIKFDYVICDCQENFKLTCLEEWKKFYEVDKPIIFINTSYMFRQFEIVNKNNKQANSKSGAYLWAKFFYESYRKKFWLRDKAKFIFIMTKENSNKMLEYQCGGLTSELTPDYLEKNKSNIKQTNSTLVKRLTPLSTSNIE